MIVPLESAGGLELRHIGLAVGCRGVVAGHAVLGEGLLYLPGFRDAQPVGFGTGPQGLVELPTAVEDIGDLSLVPA